MRFFATLVRARPQLLSAVLAALLLGTAGAPSLGTASLSAQEAALVGRVTDAEETPLARATVRLRSVSGAADLVATTDAAGRYRFDSVPLGTYRLAATREGYQEGDSTVVLERAGTHELDLALERVYALEQIVVTATRGERELADIASAVTVVTQDEIRRGRKAINLEEPLKRVPGLRVEDELGGTASRVRIVIRGTGTRANNAAGSGVRGVKVLVDGIPKNNAGGSAQDLTNVDLSIAERIEVVRGPTSVLYGNQSGGVVNIITAEGPAEPFVEVRQTVGSYGLFKEHLTAGGQVGSLSYMAAAHRTDQAGYRDRSDFNSTGFNGKLVFDLDDRSELVTVLGYDQNREESPGPLTREQFEEDPTRNNPNFAETFSVVEEFRLGMTYRLRELLGEDEVELTGFYVPRRLGPFRRVVARVPQDFTNRGASLRYLYAGDLGSLTNRLTVGADFHDTPITTGVFSPTTGDVFSHLEEGATTYGIYLQDELRLTPELMIVLAGRFDHIDFSSRDNTVPGEASRSFEEFTPKVGLTYDPLPALSLYAHYAEGFETPIIGELRTLPGGEFGFNDQVDPQRTVNYEVGARGAPLGGRLTFEAAAFHQEIRDFISPVGETPNTSFQNVARVDQLGLELASSLRVAGGLTLGAMYTYSDFTFEEFEAGAQDLSGNELPGVPPHNLFLDVSWNDPRGWYASVETQVVDEFYVNDANDALNDAYTVTNLRAGVEGLAVGEVRASPFLGVENVFDETYSAFAFINAQDRAFYNPLPGTNVYGGVSLRF